jgi:hypothetical protein
VRLPLVTLVVSDGSGKLAVRSVSWHWNAGDDVVVPVRVVKQDGSPYVLSEATVGTLAFWESELDGFPAFQVDFVLTPAEVDEEDVPVPDELAEFTVGRTDLPEGVYAVGARFVDTDEETRDTVLLPGRVEVWKAVL